MIGGSKSEIETLIYVSGKNTATVDLKTATQNVTVRLITMNGVVVGQKMNREPVAKISITGNGIILGAYIV